MSSLIRVARVEDFLPGLARRVEARDHDIALWRVDARFFAVGNICAHHHMPVLHQGVLEDLTVTCPMHGWTYHLETGCAVEGSGRVPTYPVHVTEGWVVVEVPD